MVFKRRDQPLVPVFKRPQLFIGISTRKCNTHWRIAKGKQERIGPAYLLWSISNLSAFTGVSECPKLIGYIPCVPSAQHVNEITINTYITRFDLFTCADVRAVTHRVLFVIWARSVRGASYKMNNSWLVMNYLVGLISASNGWKQNGGA